MDCPRLNRIPVDSSSIATVGYAPTTHVMEVVFRRGATYRYFDVPALVFTELLAAPSKGRYFNSRVKNRYAYQAM